MGGNGDQGWCVSLCAADKLWAKHVEAMRWIRGRHVLTVARVGGCSQASSQSQVVFGVEGSEICCVQR
jgi:hypothetical protein